MNLACFGPKVPKRRKLSQSDSIACCSVPFKTQKIANTGRIKTVIFNAAQKAVSKLYTHCKSLPLSLSLSLSLSHSHTGEAIRVMYSSVRVGCSCAQHGAQVQSTV